MYKGIIISLLATTLSLWQLKRMHTLVNQSTTISFRDIFHAIALTMRTIEEGNGINAWRLDTHKKGIIDPAHPLATERTVPPSKADGDNTGKKHNLWHYFHVSIMMPGLEQLSGYSALPELQNITLSHDKARDFVHQMDAVITHIKQYKEFETEINSFNPDTLPEDPSQLSSRDQELLQSEITRNTNHLYGRLLQIHYAHKDQAYKAYGLPKETGNYFKGGKYDIVERTVKYASNRIPQCPLRSQEGNVPDQIPLSTIMAYYGWVNNIYTVEMITPQYTGAASQAAQKLCALLDYTEQETELNLRNITVPQKVLEKIKKNDDLLSRIEAMESFLTQSSSEEPLDLAPLARIKSAFYPNAHP